MTRLIYSTTSHSPEGGFSLYALIFANGDPNDGPAVRSALSHAELALIIAADGGLRLIDLFGLRAQIVIGDMDSASSDSLDHAQANGAEIIRYPAAKDETDLELALLKAAERDCNPIYIIGAMGDRLDQSIGNIYLLALPQLRGREVSLVSHAQTAWLAYPGRNAINGHPGDTVSLLPMAGNAAGITTEGLEYPLRNETLQFGPARGMSNVLIGTQANIIFESGLLLITHTIGHA